MVSKTEVVWNVDHRDGPKVAPQGEGEIRPLILPTTTTVVRHHQDEGLRNEVEAVKIYRIEVEAVIIYRLRSIVRLVTVGIVNHHRQGKTNHTNKYMVIMEALEVGAGVVDEHQRIFWMGNHAMASHKAS
jgi:hypothetical protein